MRIGVVPAAGQSRRMGLPKASLDAGGATFLERVCAALREGGCRQVWVVVGAPEEPAATTALAAGWTRLLTNPDPGEGPITSIRVALHDTGPEVEGIVLLPVDHPLVRPATVRRVLDAAEEPGVDVAVAAYRGRRGHPAYFARTCFADLLDPALEGGARTVVHRHLERARVVETDDPGVVTDIDTPEAYEAAFGRPPEVLR